MGSIHERWYIGYVSRLASMKKLPRKWKWFCLNPYLTRTGDFLPPPTPPPQPSSFSYQLYLNKFFLICLAAWALFYSHKVYLYMLWPNLDKFFSVINTILICETYDAMFMTSLLAWWNIYDVMIAVMMSHDQHFQLFIYLISTCFLEKNLCMWIECNAISSFLKKFEFISNKSLKYICLCWENCFIFIYFLLF